MSVAQFLNHNPPNKNVKSYSVASAVTAELLCPKSSGWAFKAFIPGTPSRAQLSALSHGFSQLQFESHPRYLSRSLGKPRSQPQIDSWTRALLRMSRSMPEPEAHVPCFHPQPDSEETTCPSTQCGPASAIWCTTTCSSLSPQELCNEKDALGLNQGCFLWLEELKLLHHVLNLAKPKHRRRKVVMTIDRGVEDGQDFDSREVYGGRLSVLVQTAPAPVTTRPEPSEAF